MQNPQNKTKKKKKKKKKNSYDVLQIKEIINQIKLSYNKIVGALTTK